MRKYICKWQTLQWHIHAHFEIYKTIKTNPEYISNSNRKHKYLILEYFKEIKTDLQKENAWRATKHMRNVKFTDHVGNVHQNNHEISSFPVRMIIKVK